MRGRILADMDRRILSAGRPPGARIPFEHECSAQYACSRITMIVAPTRLATAGLNERRRKAGSIIMRAPQRLAALEVP
jgi:GntR family histidine utilization transcriptional repressor